MTRASQISPAGLMIKIFTPDPKKLFRMFFAAPILYALVPLWTDFESLILKAFRDEFFIIIVDNFYREIFELLWNCYVIGALWDRSARCTFCCGSSSCCCGCCSSCGSSGSSGCRLHVREIHAFKTISEIKNPYINLTNS